MSTQTSAGVKLSKHDAEEASRLYKEANTALEGLSKIVAKALGLKLNGQHRVMLAPKDHAVSPAGAKSKEVLEFKGVEILCTSTGCGCYDHDAQECFPC